MDKRISAYIEALVLSCTSLPSFQALPDEDKKNYSQKLRDHFNEVIFETLINNLSSGQLNTLKNLGLSTPEAQNKIEEYSSLIPSFSTKLEVALNAEVEKLKSMQLREVWKMQ